MKFKGDTPRRRRASRAAWQQWSESEGDRSAARRCAVRLVELIEPQVQLGGRQVRRTAGDALRQIRLEVPELTNEDVRRAIQVLYDTWYLGLSLRTWGKAYGYVPRIS